MRGERERALERLARPDAEFGGHRVVQQDEATRTVPHGDGPRADDVRVGLTAAVAAPDIALPLER